MLSRRSIFKMFGAGAVIAPVVNGFADDSVHVKLVEVPKIEIVPAMPDILLKESWATPGQYAAVMVLRSLNGNDAFRLETKVTVMSPFGTRFILACERMDPA